MPRRAETIDDIVKRIFRCAREVQFEARLKCSWDKSSEIRTFATMQISWAPLRMEARRFFWGAESEQMEKEYRTRKVRKQER